MRILHQPLGTGGIDLAWSFRTAPARSGALFVLCASMLVPLGAGKPKRKETARMAAHRAAPRKQGGDFLVSGRAVVPPDQPARQGLRVAIALNEWRKELAIFGDRHWHAGVLGLAASEPEPFMSVPITWERAFGGPGEARNPTGCGFGPGERGRTLPNIEYLDRRVTQPTSRPEPAGFGPVDTQWQPRLGKLGRFDDAWLADNWPLMPDDFDPSYWNEAPADQQFPEFFRGDEMLAFEHMSEDHARLEMRLPGYRARAFGQMANGRAGEIRLVLDTIDVDVDAGQAELVWRGSFPVRSPRCKEIGFLFTLCEPLDSPTDEPGWRAMFEAARRARYPTPEERAADAAAAAAARDAADEGRRAQAATTRAEAVAARAGAEARAAAAQPSVPPPDPAAARQSILAAFAQARAKAPDQAGELDDTQAKVLAAHDRAAGARTRWTRERVLAAHQAGSSLREADLSGLDLSGLDLAGAVLAGAKFSDARLAGAVLRGADLAGCDFAEATAAGADFSRAKLAQALFRKADLAGAVFDAADISRSDFAGAHCSDARFNRVQGDGARFDGVQLAGASFQDASLGRAVFTRALLDHAVFDRAQLAKADFANAAGTQVSFRGADLRNMRAREASLAGAWFCGALGARSVWPMAVLTDADFSRGQFTRAIFTESELSRALFDRAVLVDASFDDAAMQHCILTKANLLRASFTRTDLRDADLSQSNLYHAGLFAARAARARFDGSILAGTLLAS